MTFPQTPHGLIVLALMPAFFLHAYLTHEEEETITCQDMNGVTWHAPLAEPTASSEVSPAQEPPVERTTATLETEPPKAAKSLRKKKVGLKTKESALHAPALGSTHKRDVQAVFSKKKKQIESCYKRVFSKHGKNTGKITVKITLGGDGKVLRVKTVTDDIGKGLSTCIEQKIGRWRFPEMGQPVTIAKRWIFNP